LASAASKLPAQKNGSKKLTDKMGKNPPFKDTKEAEVDERTGK